MTENDYFKINLPIFKLNSGKINVPQNCTSIWFDVGTSFNSPNSIQYINRNPNGFVLAFEPDPRMYFGAYSINNFANNLWLLDDKHPTAQKEVDKRKREGLSSKLFSITEYLKREDAMIRYILVPTAIGLEDNKSRLHFDSHHGSSSLVKNF